MCFRPSSPTALRASTTLSALPIWRRIALDCSVWSRPRRSNSTRPREQGNAGREYSRAVRIRLRPAVLPCEPSPTRASHHGYERDRISGAPDPDFPVAHVGASARLDRGGWKELSVGDLYAIQRHPVL